MRKIKLVLALLLLAVLIVFVVQNLQSVELRFIVWSTSLSLALPLMIAFLAGGLTARPILRFLNNQRKSRKLASPPQQETQQSSVSGPGLDTESS